MQPEFIMELYLNKTALSGNIIRGNVHLIYLTYSFSPVIVGLSGADAQNLEKLSYHVSPDQEENINVQNLKYGSHKMHNNAFTVW
jgi:hypothetical protein